MSTQDQITTTASAEELNALHIEIEEAKQRLLGEGVSFIQKIAILGQKLIDKKEELGHGNWIPWVAANLRYSVTTATYYAKVARNFQRVENLDGATSLRQALALCDTAETGDPDTQEDTQNPFEEERPTFVSKITGSFFSKIRLRKVEDWEPREKADVYYLYEELSKLVAELKLAGFTAPKTVDAEVVE